MFMNEDENKVVDKRIDMVYLFDVKNGNPNGDPDCDNAPRMDDYTEKGYTTDVCIKSKIRRFMSNKYNNNNTGYNIYINPSAVLETTYNGVLGDVCQENNLDVKKVKGGVVAEQLFSRFCKQFYDIRTFGAVITKATADKTMNGAITGPVSMQFANSVEPIHPIELTITRCCVSTEKEKEKMQTMGTKQIIPYGLYVGTVSVDPNRAKQTGFTYGDLHEFVCALRYMMETDRTASKGTQSVRKVFVFEHSSIYGNCDFGDIEDCVEVKRINEEDAKNEIPATKFSDYNVTVNKSLINDKIKVYSVEREDEDVTMTEM